MSDQQPRHGTDDGAHAHAPDPEVCYVTGTQDCQTAPLRPAGDGGAAAIRPQPNEQFGVTTPDDPGVGQVLHRQQMRSWIVQGIFWTVVGTVAAPFVMSMLNVPMLDKHWEYLHIAFPAEIGLLISAMAFYFDPRG